MESLAKFLSNIETLSKRQQDYASKEDEIRDVSIQKLQERIDNLKDNKDQFVNEIKENLEYLTSSKHVIDKKQDLVCNDNTGLPVSNIHHDEMIDFTKDAVTLLNEFGNRDSIESSKLDNDLTSITEAIILHNENLAESVRKEKKSIDDVELAMKNIHTLSDSIHQIIINEDTAPEDLSIIDFENSAL